jgi:hypothetical protein
MYDPEAIFQDADIEMAEYAAEDAQGARMQAKGVCLHRSSVGKSYEGQAFYPEQLTMKVGEVTCTDGCGRVFADDDDWDHAMQCALWNGE